jgi:purine-binding chemotaxis protein CheW
MNAEDGFLIFGCGNALYGVAASDSSEVVSIPALARVPGAPAHVLGIFALRGEVVPVIHLLRALQLEEVLDAAAEKQRRAIVLRLTRGIVAIAASRVLGVSAIDATLRKDATISGRAYLHGPIRSGVGHVTLIDGEGFFEFLLGAQ